MPYASINGIEVYFEVEGQGPPVLYLHGGMGGARSVVKSAWDDPISGFRFIRSDRRGCGRTSAPDKGYSVASFAEDSLGLLRHFGIPKVAIIGNSAGGPIAIKLTTLEPAVVSCLVLTNTAARLWPDDAPNTRPVRTLIEALHQEGAEAAYRRRPDFARHSLEPLWRWREAEAHNRLEESKHEELEIARQAARLPEHEQMRRHVAELLTCEAYIGLDLRPLLSSIACAVFMIHGMTDTIIPYTLAWETAANIKDCKLVGLPNRGHTVLEDRDAVEMIRAFISRSL